MNANELANLLEVDSWYKLVTRKEIATMLRQQQAEIEALKMNRFKLSKHFNILNGEFTSRFVKETHMDSI